MWKRAKYQVQHKAKSEEGKSKTAKGEVECADVMRQAGSGSVVAAHVDRPQYYRTTAQAPGDIDMMPVPGWIARLCRSRNQDSLLSRPMAHSHCRNCRPQSSPVQSSPRATCNVQRATCSGLIVGTVLQRGPSILGRKREGA